MAKDTEQHKKEIEALEDEISELRDLLEETEIERDAAVGLLEEIRGIV